MKISQKILSTFKRVLSVKKEIDKEIGEIPMKSEREIWLCPLVPTDVLEEANQTWIEEKKREEVGRIDLERERYASLSWLGKWRVRMLKKIIDKLVGEF